MDVLICERKSSCYSIFEIVLECLLKQHRKANLSSGSNYLIAEGQISLCRSPLGVYDQI